MDGKEVAHEQLISEVMDYKGSPAYIAISFQFNQTKMVVMYKGVAISKPYENIFNLGIIGGKIAFLAKKESIEKMPAYILVFDGKEYGKEYGAVTGYIDNNGLPAYIAIDYKQDENGRMRNEYKDQYIVKNNSVLFELKSGEEMIWQSKEMIDVNGFIAAIVRAPKTNSLYVWYDGKKFFEGYDIHNILNVNGKLAVLAGKNKIQSIFLEK
ncbi:MAG: hypothetical protein AAB536_02645 [Patescibacteria group bacterium]